MTAIRHWSHSSLRMLSKCGVQWAYVYLEGLRQPPEAAMVRGSGVHWAREIAMTHRIERPDDSPLTADEVQTEARDYVAAAFKGEVAIDEGLTVAAVRDETIDAATRLARLDREVFHDRIAPVFVERRIEWTPPGHARPIVGVLDLLDASGGGVLRDLKTTGKTPAEAQVHEDMELTTHAALLASTGETGGKLPAVGLDALIDKKRGPDAVRFSSTRTEAHVVTLLRRAQQAEKILAAGAFTPAPADAWWCSKAWCGFWTRCPFAARPVSVAVKQPM